MSKNRLPEFQTATVDVGDLRRAISALVCVAHLSADALKMCHPDEKFHNGRIVEESADGLAALSFVLLPKERGSK